MMDLKLYSHQCAFISPVHAIFTRPSWWQLTQVMVALLSTSLVLCWRKNWQQQGNAWNLFSFTERIGPDMITKIWGFILQGGKKKTISTSCPFRFAPHQLPLVIWFNLMVSVQSDVTQFNPLLAGRKVLWRTSKAVTELFGPSLQQQEIIFASHPWTPTCLWGHTQSVWMMVDRACFYSTSHLNNIFVGTHLIQFVIEQTPIQKHFDLKCIKLCCTRIDLNK